ncbi:hypothetical protein [Rhizobium leguminosarum]|uniref:hypothetical protein n=1 Tax=Rhizobium leguminosarum TaxID=384 RepID=UPI001441071D|nr:hypothetical protein [Rhizobium leguminosarum]MBY5863293.1 hypothetical protein [Rhizobium leguminosarum]NKM04171.1 hypothetical protein [Rhizobium leguminosarum bv. viciae]
MIGIPSFDSLAHAAAAAPEGFALYDKRQARAYIKARNDFIAYVRDTLARSDLTADMKIMMINMHPGKGLR